MANRTWVGGGNDKANNASDWSPTGVPLPGDLLDMQGGTINIRGDDLAGNALTIGELGQSAAPTTLNLSHHASVSLDIAPTSTDQVTVNVEGSDTLNVFTEFPSTGKLTVNLADHARLAGGFNLIFSTATISGGDGSRFVNNGANLLQGSHVVFDTDVKGSGSFVVRTAQSSGGQLEFGGAVSRGQSVEVSGDRDRFAISRVQIDDPTAFRGSIALNPFGEVDLIGLAGAESYQLRNDILSIYSGCGVIEKLHLTTPPPASGTAYDISVRQTAAGVVIDRDPLGHTGTLLPVRQA